MVSAILDRVNHPAWKKKTSFTNGLNPIGTLKGSDAMYTRFVTDIDNLDWGKIGNRPESDAVRIRLTVTIEEYSNNYGYRVARNVSKHEDGRVEHLRALDEQFHDSLESAKTHTERLLDTYADV